MQYGKFWRYVVYIYGVHSGTIISALYVSFALVSGCGYSASAFMFDIYPFLVSVCHISICGAATDVLCFGHKNTLHRLFMSAQGAHFRPENTIGQKYDISNLPYHKTVVLPIIPSHGEQRTKQSVFPKRA